MRSSILLVVTLLVLTPACSQPAGNGEANDQASRGEADAPNNGTAIVQAADWRRIAECSSKMDAVARVYNAASVKSSGDEGKKLFDMAAQREKDAFRFKSEAQRLEMESTPDAALVLNPTDSEVEKIRRKTETAIESERGRQPFEDFVIWVGREADRCAAVMPPAS